MNVRNQVRQTILDHEAKVQAGIDAAAEARRVQQAIKDMKLSKLWLAMFTKTVLSLHSPSDYVAQAIIKKKVWNLHVPESFIINAGYGRCLDVPVQIMNAINAMEDYFGIIIEISFKTESMLSVVFHLQD